MGAPVLSTYIAWQTHTHITCMSISDFYGLSEMYKTKNAKGRGEIC